MAVHKRRTVGVRVKHCPTCRQVVKGKSFKRVVKNLIKSSFTPSQFQIIKVIAKSKKGESQYSLIRHGFPTGTVIRALNQAMKLEFMTSRLGERRAVFYSVKPEIKHAFLSDK